MPGPGHDHSAAFEDCLKDVKPKTPAGRDPDEYAHRICYSSVGKAIQKDYDDALVQLANAIEALLAVRGSVVAANMTPLTIPRDGTIKPDGNDGMNAVTIDPDVKDGSWKTLPAVGWAYRVVGQAINKDLSEMQTLLNVSIVKKSDDGRHVGGWASVEVPDRQNELISIDAFTPRVIQNFLERTAGRVHLQHQDIPIGKITVFERRMYDSEKGIPGLWLEMDLFQLDSLDEAVRDAVRANDLTGFSIKGKALGRGKQCTPDMCYAYVPGIELYGISAVERPANPDSLIQVQKAVRDHMPKKRVDRLELLAKQWGIAR